MTVATALDNLPRPPCAELLGWHVLDARPKDGKTVGFVEARLLDSEGTWIARASASVRLVPTTKLRARAEVSAS